MCRKEIMQRAELIFSKLELDRMVFYEYQHQEYIRVDVHGLTCNQVKVFIKNIINVVRGAFELIIIHGYLHGTKIKEMIYTQLGDMHRISDMKSEDWNPGVTYLMIK
ncbi:MAG: hypothetical protein K6F30_08745 [Lachnospiraceae bacterium]|nr:hypothetical protein [Lachnospiraceae bacterium]